jgi:hypothetical protein
MLKMASTCAMMMFAAVIGPATEAKLQRGSSDDLSLRQLYRMHRFPPAGKCYASRITRVTSRFGGPPTKEDGVVVFFANGLQQVSYELVPQVLRSRPGDKVTSCVSSLPAECPPNDTRGIYYRTHDWRTHENWTLPDSQHECGGA